MDKIQVVFLFSSCRQLGKEQRQQIVQIVQEEFANTYHTEGSSICVDLEDGVNKIDCEEIEEIILAIHKDINSVNEAVFRTQMVHHIADRLKSIRDLQLMGFTGNISWRDGLFPVPAEKDIPNNSQGVSSCTGDQKEYNAPGNMMDYHKRAQMYHAENPKYTYEMLKIPKETLEQIDRALDRIKYERKLFDEWGLYAIMAHPVAAMSLYGPPGTGKTLAAEAIANHLGKKIIRASYADIESKYVGEGPKNVSALFLAAEEQDAVLFIDEADSLLSKRLVNVQESSGQAINSMRSELLINLERFHGIVMFATNLVVNYDAAFISRLINIEFKLPDVEQREEIWKTHILPRKSGEYTLKIPLASDVDIRELAEKYELCGRDIRNAVIDACTEACAKEMTCVDMHCFCVAAQQQLDTSRRAQQAKDHTSSSSLTDAEKKVIAEQMQKKLDNQKQAAKDNS